MKENQRPPKAYETFGVSDRYYVAYKRDRQFYFIVPDSEFKVPDMRTVIALGGYVLQVWWMENKEDSLRRWTVSVPWLALYWMPMIGYWNRKKLKLVV